MEDNLNFWLNGQPVIFDTDFSEYDFWLNGQPFIMLGGEPNIIVGPFPTFRRI